MGIANKIISLLGFFAFWVMFVVFLQTQGAEIFESEEANILRNESQQVKEKVKTTVRVEDTEMQNKLNLLIDPVQGHTVLGRDHLDLGGVYSEATVLFSTKTEFEAALKKRPNDAVKKAGHRSFLLQNSLKKTGEHDVNVNSATNEKKLNGLVLAKEKIEGANVLRAESRQVKDKVKAIVRVEDEKIKNKRELPIVPTQSQTLLEDASVLLKQKNSLSAYRLLEKYEDEYAGWWEYDYLLGIAALESGMANLAIFALQRAMAVNPSLAGAHVDLGRAYYEVNEFLPAKAEFEAVLKKRPNRIVKKIAHQYLSSINKKLNPKRFSQRYSLQTTGGYDSNVNSATNEKTFNGFTLAKENIQTPSAYFSFIAGAYLQLQTSRKNSYSVVLNARQRANTQMENVNYLSTSIQAAWTRKYKHVGQTLGLQLGRTKVSGGIESYATSVSLGLRFGLIPDGNIHLNGSVGESRFAGDLSNRNSMQRTLSLSAAKRNTKSPFPFFRFSAIFGDVSPKDSQSASAKKMAGGRLASQKKFNVHFPVEVNVSSGFMFSQYKEDSSSFVRKDILADFGGGVLIRPRKKWEVSLKSSLMKNKSNVTLYQYSRISTSFSLKKFF